MTLIEALEKAYEMWSWLAEHPLKDKKAYAEEVEHSFAMYIDYDPLCEYFNKNCEQCAKVVRWPDMKACDCRLMGMWLDQLERAKSTLSLSDIKASADTAAKIRDIIKEALDREIKNHHVHKIKNDHLEMDIIQEGERVKIKIYYQDERFRRVDDEDAHKSYTAQNGMRIQSVNCPEIRRYELYLMGDYDMDSSWFYDFDSVQEACNWISRCREAIEDWAKNCDTFREPKDTPTEMEDKQLVWCWDDKDTCARIVKFYDKVNMCTFRFDGYRCGATFDCYEPYQGEWPEWAKEAYLKLKGCKSLQSEKLYNKIKAVDQKAAEEFLKEVAKAELDEKYAGNINYSPDDESISGVFLWHATSQGAAFWRNIRNKLNQRKED